jgi:hypothetical protein
MQSTLTFSNKNSEKEGKNRRNENRVDRRRLLLEGKITGTRNDGGMEME